MLHDPTELAEHAAEVATMEAEKARLNADLSATAPIAATAAKVIDAIVEAFKPWTHDVVFDGDDDLTGRFVRLPYGPKLVADYRGYGPSIVWEEGSPYGWVHLIGGGVDEEFGFRVPATKLPEDVDYLDPIDSIAVMVVMA